MLKYISNKISTRKIINELRTGALRVMSTGHDTVEGVVCKESDVPENGMKEFQLGENGKVLLVKQEGCIYAIGTKCSHYGAPLVTGALGKGIVRCPWHGACFDLKTGDIEDCPGLDSLPSHKVSVLKNGDVKVSAKKSLLEANVRFRHTVARNPKSEDTFVIIGGGAAGSSCAESLRQESFGGRLIIISKDKFLPYDRPKVSKQLDADITKIALRPKEFYDKNDIELLNNEAVVQLDTKNKIVRTSSGKEFPYTRAFIACGVNARSPSFMSGHELENVFTIRSLEDANKIASTLKPELKVVIIGSSFIGMEAAAYCVNKVASVTVVGRTEVPFENVLGNTVGRCVGKLFESKGVKLIGNAQAEKFVGENGKLTGVVVNGETIPADICIVGVGVEYDTTFLKDTNVKLTSQGGVDVNEFLQTSDPNVFAGGDVAYAPIHGSGGKKGNIGHWQLAQYHGRRAALNMLGQKKPIKSVPFFYSMLFGKGLRYAGYGVNFNDVITVGDVEELKFVAYLCRDSDVIAAASIASDPVVAKFANLLYEDKKLPKTEAVNNKWLTTSA